MKRGTCGLVPHIFGILKTKTKCENYISKNRMLEMRISAQLDTNCKRKYIERRPYIPNLTIVIIQERVACQRDTFLGDLPGYFPDVSGRTSAARRCRNAIGLIRVGSQRPGRGKGQAGRSRPSRMCRTQSWKQFGRSGLETGRSRPIYRTLPVSRRFEPTLGLAGKHLRVE